MTGPVVVHEFNVLDPLSNRRVFRGDVGLTLRQLAPVSDLPTLCRYNGELVLPEDLDWIPTQDDHVSFLTLPKGGGGNVSMQVIGVVLIVVGAFYGNPNLIAAGAGLLISGLIPVPSAVSALAPSAQNSPSPTYSIQLGGNSARIGEAIPVVYGRHLIMPDFATQPYSEFTSNGDQFYHALLCIGQCDEFTVEQIMIDDTNITHFSDVELQYVGPNFALPLSLVDTAVVNAPEVAANDLVFGKYVGPFAACGAGLQAVFIGIDIFCPKGLYFAENDGTLTEKTASWFVEARKITNKGSVSGDWFLIGSESLTDSSNKAIRRSYKYAITPGRYEIRVSRLEIEDTNNRAGHALQWGAMRAYLNIPSPLEPTATFLALRIRANSQLSGLSQRRIGLIIRRWLPTWSPGGGWAAPAETRSIAWALADVLRNVDYGAGLPDYRIDLQTLYELDALWTVRGDTFNGVFDKRLTIWQALTTIARAGRARPIMRGSVFTFIRDSQQELPVALYSMRNIQRGSFNIDYTMVNDDTGDGVEIQFFNEDTWSSDFVRLPSPGVIESTNPANMSMMGLTNTNQVLREAAYIVADAAYRRSAISFTTEMEGYLPSYGDLIAVSHDLTGWGNSGDIEELVGTTATTTEDLLWSVGDNYCILIDDQGDVHGPFKVGTDPNPRTMHFIEVPPPGLIYTGTDRERTRYAMGPANLYAKMCRVISISPKNGDTVQIRAIVEDNRVHAADLPYQQGPEVTARLGRYAPDGIPNYDAASDAQRNAYGFFANEDLVVGINEDEGYIYAN